jgi:hypothetical protein
VNRAATRIDERRNEQRHQTLAGRLQDSYFGCMQRIGLVLDRVSTYATLSSMTLAFTENFQGESSKGNSCWI